MVFSMFKRKINSYVHNAIHTCKIIVMLTYVIGKSIGPENLHKSLAIFQIHQNSLPKILYYMYSVRNSTITLNKNAASSKNGAVCTVDLLSYVFEETLQ